MNIIFQSRNLFLSLPPSLLFGLRELLDSVSVLFVTQLQRLVIRVMKLHLVIQLRTHCEAAVRAFPFVAMSLWATPPLTAASPSPCSWTRKRFGEYIQAKNSSARKTAERTCSLRHSLSGAGSHCNSVLEADEGSRLCVQKYICWRVFRLKSQTGYDLGHTVQVRLKKVNSVSLQSNRFLIFFFLKE